MMGRTLKEEIKTVGASCFGEEPSVAPSGDPEEFYLQKGQKMQKPPLHVVQAYGWEWKTYWV